MERTRKRRSWHPKRRKRSPNPDIWPVPGPRQLPPKFWHFQWPRNRIFHCIILIHLHLPQIRQIVHHPLQPPSATGPFARHQHHDQRLPVIQGHLQKGTRKRQAETQGTDQWDFWAGGQCKWLITWRVYQQHWCLEHCEDEKIQGWVGKSWYSDGQFRLFGGCQKSVCCLQVF